MTVVCGINYHDIIVWQFRGMFRRGIERRQAAACNAIKAAGRSGLPWPRPLKSRRLIGLGVIGPSTERPKPSGCRNRWG